MNEKLNEANQLSVEIKELEYFINTLDVYEISKTKPNTTAIISKHVETKTTYSILGKRFYGIGTRENNINVPTSMIPALVMNAMGILKEKQEKFDSLFKETK